MQKLLGSVAIDISYNTAQCQVNEDNTYNLITTADTSNNIDLNDLTTIGNTLKPVDFIYNNDVSYAKYDDHYKYRLIAGLITKVGEKSFKVRLENATVAKIPIPKRTAFAHILVKTVHGLLSITGDFATNYYDGVVKTFDGTFTDVTNIAVNKIVNTVLTGTTSPNLALSISYVVADEMLYIQNRLGGSREIQIDIA